MHPLFHGNRAPNRALATSPNTTVLGRALPLATFMAMAMLANTAQAYSIRVTTTGDGPGTCAPASGQVVCTTLRGAVAQANALVTDDHIFFDNSLIGSTITLTQGQLSIANNGTLIIYGSDTTISGNNASRVLHIQSGTTVTLRDLTIANGNGDGYGGGGIFNYGILTLENVTVRDNRTDRNSGGGGIVNIGTLSLLRSTISNNHSVSSGGGIYNQEGATLITRHSTISGNSAAGSGGGIDTAGSATIEFSTLSDNRVTPNFRGAGINVYKGTTTINYSVLANGSATDDCHLGLGLGTIHAAWSHFENGTDCVNGSTFQLGTGDPRLGPLANNGGLTRTHLPLPGSPLIDRIWSFGPLPEDTDQRGVARPQGNNLDIGAVEVVHPLFEDGFEGT